MLESSVEHIFSHYSHCRPARLQDEPELLQFMNQQPMKTKSWSLSFQRGQDYFSFYRLSGGTFFPFVMTDSHGAICGSSGLIRLSTSVKGIPKQLGYLCDLRVDSRAPARVKSEWRSIYLELLTRLPSSPNPSERCEAFVTSVFDTNTNALQALTKRLKGISYIPLQRYVARSLAFHPWPSCYARLDSHLILHTQKMIDRSYIKDWLKMNTGFLGLPYLPNEESIDVHIAHIENQWAPNNPFPLVEIRNREGERIAACWPWLSSKVRAPVIYDLSPLHIGIGKLLPFIGRSPVVSGQPLSQVYLTHVMIDPSLPQAEKSKALRKMVIATYQLAVRAKAHLVTWIEGCWPAAPHAHIWDGFVFDMPATMYQVIPEALKNEKNLHLPTNLPLYLEGASL